MLKKSDPARALVLLDEAAALAASVHNFWWQGIALTEAAATRAVHGEPLAAARECIAVLDHWDRVGDRTQQLLHLRYVTRLLVRLEAHEDAVMLHHHLLVVRKPSPLDPAHAATLLGGDLGRAGVIAARGAALSPAEAIEFARAALRRAASRAH